MAKYICNPVTMNYPTKVDTDRNTPGLHYGMLHVPHREAADITIVPFKGRYYLDGSFSAGAGYCGFWHSDDLVEWNFESGKGLNVMHAGAADFCRIDDWLYQTASSRTMSSIHRTKDPMSREFEHVKDSFGFWDPCLFADDDGRVYLYWGCSNADPIWGIELDKDTFETIGEPVVLVEDNSDHHGFERNGWNNDRNVGFLRTGETDAPGLINNAPWIEGAYMNKYNGKYYLQYAGPATEHPIYCDGYYVSDSPLGPFEFAETSPFSCVFGGFYPGAGHGSTFEDYNGNWWHGASMVGAAGDVSSRKMGIYPLGFDEDGIMYCDQNYADYPHIMPDKKVDPKSTFPGWMLLSYRKNVEVSSEIPDHPARYLTDETCRTYWAASVRRPGEWVKLDLGKVMDVRAVQLNLVDHDLAGLFKIPYNAFTVLPPEEQFVRQRWLMEGSVDGENWEILCDKREADTDRTHDLIVFEEGVDVRYIKVTSYETAFFNSFAMSGLRVFGHAGEAVPAKAENIVIDRNKEDPCCVRITWDKAEGADGYNVRWGIAENKLYHSTLVYDNNELVLNALNDNVSYFVQVDAFNGSGITEGDVLAAQ